MENVTIHMDFNNEELRILAASLNVFIRGLQFQGDCNEANFNNFRNAFDSVASLYDKIYSVLIEKKDESD